MSGNERPRAPLFSDPTSAEPPKKSLNLARFAPKPAAAVDAEVVEAISAETGFTTKHAKTAHKPPKKRDGRTLKKSPRTTQFNVRLRPEMAEKFWAGAEKEGLEYADDFLAHLLELYDGGRS